MEKLAIEYGDGLYALAKEEGIEEEIRSCAADVRSALLENPGYISLLTSKKIEKAEKEQLLKECFKERVHPYFFNFLLLMNERGYIPYVTACLYRYEERYLQAHGIEKVTVTSAAPLDEDERTRLRASIEKKLGKTASIVWKVDRALLAGVRIEAEGLLIENSAKQRLNELKRALHTSLT